MRNFNKIEQTEYNNISSVSLEGQIAKECIGFDKYIEVDSLARAYVPNQILCTLYAGDVALLSGTAFPELNKPYSKKGGK